LLHPQLSCFVTTSYAYRDAYIPPALPAQAYACACNVHFL
jgi:hypothetical protein